MVSKLVWLSSFAGCLFGATLCPALEPAAGEGAGIPHFGPDVATAWQVNHAHGDDYLLPESGPRPGTFDPPHPFVSTPPDGPNQPTLRLGGPTNPLFEPLAAGQ